MATIITAKKPDGSELKIEHTDEGEAQVTNFGVTRVAWISRLVAGGSSWFSIVDRNEAGASGDECNFRLAADRDVIEQICAHFGAEPDFEF